MTLKEKSVERAKSELEDGLKELVALYIIYRRDGNVSLAQMVRGRIEHHIHANDLDSDTVYFCYYYLSIFDVEDELIRELRSNPKNWFILHCDDEHTCRYGDLSLNDFIKKTDRRNEVEITIEIGREKKCGRCGEIFLFDKIKPEKLFEKYRKRMRR